MMLFGTCSVVMASHSSVLPSGPSIFQWVLFGPIVLTSSMFSMKRGNICGFVQMAYNRSEGALISIVFSTVAMMYGTPYYMQCIDGGPPFLTCRPTKKRRQDECHALALGRLLRSLTAGATLGPYRDVSSPGRVPSACFKLFVNVASNRARLPLVPCNRGLLRSSGPQS